MEGSGDRVRSSYYSKLNQVKTYSSSGNSSSEDGKKSVLKSVATAFSPVAPPVMPKKESGIDDAPVVEVGEKLLEKYEDPNNEGFALNYIEKAGHDLRMKYLYSLANMGLWVTMGDKPKTHQTGTFALFFHFRGVR